MDAKQKLRGDDGRLTLKAVREAVAEITQMDALRIDIRAWVAWVFAEVLEAIRDGTIVEFEMQACITEALKLTELMGPKG